MSYLHLFRLEQCVKNLAIFLPIFFAGRLFELGRLIPVLAGFVVFSLGAAAVYALNDCFDAEQDRQHPQKKKRPVAAGEISPRLALFLALILFIASLGFSYFISLSLFGLLLIYFLLNILYSGWLKQVALLDVTVLSIGFVIRIVVGAVLAQVALSTWIILISFLLAFFLSLAKRRDDVVLFRDYGLRSRLVIENYSVDFIDSALSVVAGVLIMSYILYSVSPEIEAKFQTSSLFVTALFVLLGVLRYRQISLSERGSGSPTLIFLRDHFIQGCIFLWLLSFGLIIYL